MEETKKIDGTKGTDGTNVPTAPVTAAAPEKRDEGVAAPVTAEPIKDPLDLILANALTRDDLLNALRVIARRLKAVEARK